MTMWDHDNWEFLADHFQITVFAINNFGTGQHPRATLATLKLFTPQYARDCLERTTQSPSVNGTGVLAALDALAALPASRMPAPETPVIAAARIDTNIEFGRGVVFVTLAGTDKEDRLFAFYIDELRFAANEFIGLTPDQARALFLRRDTEYLQS